ncbi:peptidylprolyl isomerase [Cellulophaga omnivescoria]|uniref:peptidylprolyl isomerase n=1 Tax=Cellulophaga omnivescoria TaxID=1888890 RepID=UPI0009874836|nr:peptidylprolyl isomerase [Cellulophaga omnivescoria]WBU89872.1 peptidylprolyl isomerase [Cellulophaga omnivescoria]
MKNKNNNITFLLAMLLTVTFTANAMQEQEQADDVVQIAQDTIKSNFKRVKLDGVSAVVGDYVILDSDIEKTLIDLRSQGVSEDDVTKCGLLGKLMEDRLYAHQAVQDSLLVSDDEVNATSERQIQGLVGQIGSMDKLLKYYKKDSQEALREDLFKINKLRMLSERMQQKIVEEIEITPEEVRQFYKKIPKEERPVFGAQLEIAQIVKQPEASDEEKQKVIDKLNKIREDVLEGGSSFKIKAIISSEDEGSRSNGGFYKLTKETNFVKEFKDVAFGLKEGEVSEPFETKFGFHIIYLEKIRGQERDVRHILMAPKVSDERLEEARIELEKIRQRILDGELTFAEAALNFSDQKETKYEGGQLRNPQDFGTKFELTKMQPELYNQVRDIKDNEISMPILEVEQQGGAKKYKIMKITNRYDEHVADFAQDYTKIQELALTQKRVDAIQKWMVEHINDTYVSINKDNKDCEFKNNWFKK